MGNAILREYEELKKPIGSAGIFKKQWQIFGSKSLKNANPVSIFIIQKDSLPSPLQTEEFYRIIRNDVNTLIKLHHPGILRVLHPLDESRSAFVMVTEPVIGSLSNLISDSRCSVPGSMNFELSDLDIKNGIRQIAETLQFCHRTPHIVHYNISPSNILISEKRYWKIGGFYFATTEYNSISFNFNNYDFDRSFLPSLDYIPPEIISPSPVQANSISDSFSLGKLAFRLHQYKKMKETTHNITFDSIHNLYDVRAYESHISSMLNNIDLAQVPSSLPVRALLNKDPAQRMKIEDFLASEYFRDVLISTLRFLDSILEKEITQRIKFLKQLPNALQLFDDSIKIKNILPPLLLQLTDASLAIFALPSIFIISKILTRDQFQSTVLPHLLRQLSQVTSIKMHGAGSQLDIARQHIQLAYVLLEDLNMIIEKTSDETQGDYVVPLLVMALDSDNPALKKQGLKVIVSVAQNNKFSHRHLKEKILPRICTICSAASTQLPVRVNSMLAISKIFQLFDVDTVSSTVLKAVDEAVQHDHSPAILMCACGIYDSISKLFGTEISVTKILPKMAPLALNQGLNLNQFKIFMKTLHDIINKLEEYRMKELKERNYIETEAANLPNLMKNETANNYDFMENFSATLNSEYPKASNNTTSAKSMNDDVFSNMKIDSSPASLDAFYDLLTPSSTTKQPQNDFFASSKPSNDYIANTRGGYDSSFSSLVVNSSSQSDSFSSFNTLPSRSQMPGFSLSTGLPPTGGSATLPSSATFNSDTFSFPSNTDVNVPPNNDTIVTISNPTSISKITSKPSDDIFAGLIINNDTKSNKPKFSNSDPFADLFQ